MATHSSIVAWKLPRTEVPWAGGTLRAGGLPERLRCWVDVTRTPQSGHALNSWGEDSAALRGQGPLTDGQRQLSQGGDLSGEGGGEVNRTMSDLPTPSLHHQAFY